MAKYTQIPTNTFERLQMNAGILVDKFTPSTGVVGNLLGATTGGIQFADTPEFSDFGEDIDNCPKNMMELKKIDNRDVVLSGTFVTVDVTTAKKMSGAADVDPDDETHIVPRRDLKLKDFEDLWFVGDYSDVNTGENAGYIAIHMMNALNTSGFAIQTTDKGKGQFAFSFTGHYSMDAQDLVPYEIYIKVGEEEPEPAPVVPSVVLDKETITLAPEGEETLTATVVPEGTTVVWTSSDEDVALVDGGTVTGVAVGTATITATITVDGVDYTDTCAVTVEE